MNLSSYLAYKGIRYPALGLGGGGVFSHGKLKQAQDVFETAINLGVRYIDTAYSYKHSQERLGQFFQDMDADSLFVATKSTARDKSKFLRELDESIEKLGRIPDVMHIHSINKFEEFEICKKGGALEAVIEAREKGMCRYIGLTSHDDPETAWEVIRWNPGVFDIAMVAVNPADTRFLDRFVPYCYSNDIVTVAMKVMGKGQLIRPDGPGVRTADQALRFALSNPFDLAVIGFSFPQEIEEIANSIENFAPMPLAEMRQIIEGTQSYSQDMWFYRKDVSDWDKAVNMRQNEDDYTNMDW